MEKKTMVIIGTGPGLGMHIAEEFGSHGLRIILCARREEKLKEYAALLSEKGIEAEYRVMDCGNHDSVRSILNQIGEIDILLYNAAVMKGMGVFEISPEELMRRYQTDIAGALCAVQTAVPLMRGKKEGTILFTGGGLAFAPMAAAASMSMHKAALRSLALMLHEELKKENIYAGIVNIKGGVGMNEYYDPAKLAKLYWRLYTERNVPEITY